MQAYSTAALAPVIAASPISSTSSHATGAGLAVASDSAERPLAVATAAQTLASLVLEGLSDQDLAGFARRLLPHLQEGLRDRARAHIPPTRWRRSLRNLACRSAKAVRCAIARHELRAVKRGSRWIISAEAVSAWAAAPDAHRATARRRPASLAPAPKAAGPSLRSVLCGESHAARPGLWGGSR